MQFALTITLGNDAMRTGGDLAHALQHVAALLLVPDPDEPLDTADEGTIRDTNGNRVGNWQIA